MDVEEIDYEDILAKYRSDPFTYVEIAAMHTGKIRFKVKKGDKVAGVSGKFRHIPGTMLFELIRERNFKPVNCQTNGEVSDLCSELEGQFVEAGTVVMTIRHPMKKREIIEQILRKVLTPFPAPETAKYYFSMDVQNRIEKFGQRQVKVHAGDEVFTMSLMKRDTPVYYQGETGIIHSVYFTPGQSMGQGDPLIGICPPATLPMVEKIITRVKAEWE